MAIDPNPSAAASTATATAVSVVPPSVTATAERPFAPRIVTPAPAPAPSSSPWAPPYPDIIVRPYEKSWMHVLDVTQRKKARKQPKSSNPQKPLPLLKDLPSSHPHLKVGSSSSASAAIPVLESNGNKNMREKYKGDALTVVKNRNVRLTEGSSLYALCRSWLRNGFPEEIPPRRGSTGRSLPKPSPIPKTIEDLQMKEREEEEEEEKDGEVEQQEEQGSDDAQEEGEESVENVSTEDLFKRHIKRAKKVRARLREVRLKRIARYKSRLALLLPPLVEQFASGTAA